MKSEDRARVFISHHSSKAEDAEAIEAALAKRGVDCWIAPRDVPPGEPFDMAVRRAIDDASAVLLLFCAESDRSKHVKRELILADDSKKPIIPVRLENIAPGELAYHLADSQWIDWVERREAVIDRVAVQARGLEARRRREADRESIAARAATIAGVAPAAAPPPPLPAAPNPEQDLRRKRALAVFGGLALAVLLWNLPIWRDSDDPGFSITVEDDRARADERENAATPDAGADRTEPSGSVRIDTENRQIVIRGDRDETDNAID